MQFCRLIYPCSRLGSICKFGRDGKPDLEREWWLVGGWETWGGGVCAILRGECWSYVHISSNSHCIALSLFGQFMSLHHSWSGVGYMHLMWLQIWHISVTLHVMSCISTGQLRNWRYGCKNWKKASAGPKVILLEAIFDFLSLHLFLCCKTKPNSALQMKNHPLYYISLLSDDQHRNTNVNDKDHLVGQLTTLDKVCLGHLLMWVSRLLLLLGCRPDQKFWNLHLNF